MTSIPSNFDRVPTRLASQLTRQGINAANAQILRAQVELSTSKRVLKPSDDPIAASLINVLDQRITLADQRERNLAHASSVLGVLDQSLESLNDTLQEARTIASSQVGVQSDSGTRRQQAVLVQSLIDGALQSLNTDYAGLHVFGGERTGDAPFVPFLGGYRYVGAGDGLRTDLADGLNIPITLGGSLAAGALSARQEGQVDLNRALSASTRIEDLRGPSPSDAPLGVVTVTMNDGSPVTVDVDLSPAKTVGDITNIIESAIRIADPGALAGAYPTGVAVSGERIGFAINAGWDITIADGPAGASATRLGLAGFTFDSANPTNITPESRLNPRLTDDSTLGTLFPSPALTYGDITFRNGGRAGTVTTNASMTIGQFREAVARLNLGIRVEIDDSGDSINVINEVSGFRMAIEDGPGSTAATTLGIRTILASTPLSVFNDGRGVEIADGEINPVTGLPDPNRNVDFRVTLADGSTFNVDLVPSDTDSVQALLTKINAEAAAAGFGAVFSASISATTNAIEFTDSSGGAGQTAVTSLNAFAARDLGLEDAVFTPGAPARLVASDRTTVRVDSVLSSLIDLRDALQNDDVLGITFAGERIEAGIERAIQSRSLVGGRAARIEDLKDRLQETSLLDQSVKSDLQDLDYIEAASRFSLLQTQLQAGLQSAASIRSLSLLNFLG